MEACINIRRVKMIEDNKVKNRIEVMINHDIEAFKRSTRFSELEILETMEFLLSQRLNKKRMTSKYGEDEK